MGSRYQQLSLEDRCTIASLQAEGRSLRQIAAALDRAPSTVARELKRNIGRQTGYRPAYAEEQAKATLEGAQPRPLDRSCVTVSSTGFARLVTRTNRRPPGLGGWRMPSSAMRASTASSMPRSPAPMTSAGAVICRAPKPNAATVAIKAAALRASLKTGFPSLKGHGRLTTAQPWPLGSRPHIVLKVWPGRPHPARPKFTHILLPRGLQTGPRAYRPSPARSSRTTARRFRKTMTFDNGTEFAHHSELHSIDYPDLLLRSPRPVAERRNRKRHRTYAPLPAAKDRSCNPPRSATSMQSLPAYNNTPRKCLEFKTPAEVFCHQLLHFKCESTSRLSRG